jgi:hypothetical protein
MGKTEKIEQEVETTIKINLVKVWDSPTYPIPKGMGTRGAPGTLSRILLRTTPETFKFLVDFLLGSGIVPMLTHP